jgi:hypothetical protein
MPLHFSDLTFHIGKVEVKIMETDIFKNEEVSFLAIYEYCSNADEYFETEEMIKVNSLAMKDAYRKKVGLLLYREIIEARKNIK